MGGHTRGGGGRGVAQDGAAAVHQEVGRGTEEAGAGGAETVGRPLTARTTSLRSATTPCTTCAYSTRGQAVRVSPPQSGEAPMPGL